MQPLLSATALDPRDPVTASIMRNIQGNILKGHGRDHTANIFLSFTNQIENIKNYLCQLAKDQVTSCYQQLKEREIFKRNQIPGGLNMFMFFTKPGLEALNFEDIGEWGDEAFVKGMADRQGILCDPDRESWETGFQKEIHCMILLADNDQRRLCLTAKDILNHLVDAENNNLVPLAKILTVEYGHTIRNANGDGLEHNGYVDGVSQPLFLKDEIEEHKKFHDLKVDNKGNSNTFFNPVFPLDQVLVKDSLAERAENLEEDDKKFAYGSYFVFRKLEQNVRKFKQDEAEIGKKLFPNNPEKRELAGAWLVGRFEDGTPVQVQGEEGLYGSGAFNNFNYAGDPSDGKCPHFAHIRKSNPRINGSRSSVMARRGIPFGHRDVSTETDPIPEQSPEGGVGLLFMSYQASLTRQFETIQKEVNKKSDNTYDIDPIIGQQKDYDTINGVQKKGFINGGKGYQFPNDWDTNIKDTKFFTFKNHITMKGGEYFFAPSIPFLQSLKQ